MNSKERYEEMIMEMIEFDSEDIIVTSFICDANAYCPNDVTCPNNVEPQP